MTGFSAGAPAEVGGVVIPASGVTFPTTDRYLYDLVYNLQA